MLARSSACAIYWKPSTTNAAEDSRDAKGGLMRPDGKVLKFSELAYLRGAESPAEPRLCVRKDLKVGE
jgi:hypothetical protein